MKQCRIILVDDNGDDADFLKMALEQTQRVVIQSICCSYEEFMEVLHNAKPPDVIVCDIHIPGKNGIDVCKELYEAESFRHIPLVLFSVSLPSEKVKMSAANYNVTTIILKPDTMEGYAEVAAQLVGICVTATKSLNRSAA